jgi:hypothetical protein
MQICLLLRENVGKNCCGFHLQLQPS